MNVAMFATVVSIATILVVLIAMALAWPSTLLAETQREGDGARIGLVLFFGVALAAMAFCIVMVAGGEWPV